MKPIARIFFKFLRIILGPPMLLWEWLTRPQGVVRDRAAQAGVDAECRNLVLYQFKTCPFCIKVRQECRRLSLTIERRDAREDDSARGELAHGGGRVMVPCLKIVDPAGHSEWLYESEKIIDYLRARFASS